MAERKLTDKEIFNKAGAYVAVFIPAYQHFIMPEEVANTFLHCIHKSELCDLSSTGNNLKMITDNKVRTQTYVIPIQEYRKAKMEALLTAKETVNED